MSHFSKITTDISDLDILKKTIIDLGFNYKAFLSCNNDIGLHIYDNTYQSQPLFSFEYNDNSYCLVVDMECWNLEFQLSSFYEKLKQRYSCNVILRQSLSNGFNKVQEKVMSDGSIKVVIQKWS